MLMRRTLILFVWLWLWLGCWHMAKAQPEATGPADFPIMLSVQFHALSMPFKNLGANLRNVGIGIGTAVHYGGSPHWQQQVQLVWYRNKAVGNGLLLYTQAAWRPGIGNDGFAEVKAGVGYLLSFRPVPVYSQQGGVWVSHGKAPKGMLAVPVGIGAAVAAQGQSSLAPFVNYQLMLVSGYNSSVPLVPQTLLQVGTYIERDE